MDYSRIKAFISSTKLVIRGLRIGRFVAGEWRATVSYWAQSRHLLAIEADGKFSSKVVEWQ